MTDTGRSGRTVMSRRPRWRDHDAPMGRRAITGVCVLLCLVVLCITVTASFLLSLRHDEVRLDERAVPFASAVAAASLNAKGVANDQRGFLLTGDATFLDEVDDRLGAARAALDDAATSASGEDQQTAVRRAHDGFERWVQSLRQEFANYRAGDRHAAVSDALGANRDLRKGYEAWLGRAQGLADSAVNQDAGAVDVASSHAVRVALAVLVAALIVGCVVSWWLVRAIIVPLNTLTAIIVAGGRG